MAAGGLADLRPSGPSPVLVCWLSWQHSALAMFELDSMPDLLKPCGLVFPRQEEQYNQLIQDILVTKSDISHGQEVS